MPKLLAICPYPYRAADTRYRISQFAPHLEAQGWHVSVSSFMDDGFFHMYHLHGRTVEKVARMAGSTARRLGDVVRAGGYDVVLLHKEAFPFGPPLIETLLRKRVARVVYDMDDAFWSHPPQRRQFGKQLRDPQRIPKMLRMADHVLAGNEFLADFARRHNPSVSVFPTVIDLERYRPREEHDDGIVTIGWVGRWSSAEYLAVIEQALRQLLHKYPQVRIRLVGADASPFGDLEVELVPWSLEREVEAIAGFDIGIMPLPDDVYSRGKCGLKLLQYMALAIPGVASPVGVNSHIVDDGVNGFLAATQDEWVAKLERLIVDRQLRATIGHAGFATVERSYSVQGAVGGLVDALAPPSSAAISSGAARGSV